MTPSLFKVNQRTEEINKTFTLHLIPQDGNAASPFRPGQFNMLYSFGAGEVPISHSGSPDEGGAWTHTIRSVGPVTQGLECLREGDIIGVRGPFGYGWPMEAANGLDLVIVAGGLGLAPLRPAIYSFLSSNTKIRSLRLFYGARKPSEVLYRKEIANWSKHFPVHVTVDYADEDWDGSVGVVTNLLSAATLNPKKTLAFICGPEVMMRFTVQELLKQGLERSSIYLSMERNMKCATGHCGHCQWGPEFICRDGPVFEYGKVEKWFQIREL